VPGFGGAVAAAAAPGRAALKWSAAVFERVTVHASDLAASERFYVTVPAVLGFEHQALRWGHFSLAAAGPDTPVTRRLHIGFAAGSQADLDRFHEAGLRAGHRDDGAPGPRPQYGDDYG
jgi:hypothetical protein